ncbi:M56 family metallopeptidase [Psychroserpens jangbogonensis]|uniref:M56 family metallopeptidase n=1 Tax=Psychroserpens jangbogonensis TaxID=1484460 RepID=UPI00053F07E8|nr:M56 family metallopeptidase [Psychroserpens jangbogonensis]
MLHYILQVIAFQLGFLVVYDVFLRKETFFNWNRVYLLATAMLSVLIPFIKLDIVKAIMPEEFVIRLPEVIIGNVTETSSINPDFGNLAGITFASESTSLWSILLFSGMCVALIILAFKIFKLVLLASQQPKHWSNNLLVIKLINSNAAFSFFHYVFLGEKIDTKDRSSILEHEMVHVKQKHTLDLLFFEVLRIVFWFNPLIYMYQNRIATLHEYIADAKAVKQQSKAEYYDNLLAQVFETRQFSFVNPFFKQSLIKKRIIMLSKSKSKQINILKYALLFPMVCSMLIYTSSYATEKTLDIEETVLTEGSQSSNDKETVLTKKIKAVIHQVEIKGNVTAEEDEGFELLVNLVSGTELDLDLVKNVQAYASRSNQTALMKAINTVFEQIQVQGELSEYEEKSLKRMLVLTSEDGINNPALQDVIETVEVPFGVVDEVPVMPACQNLKSNDERKTCLSKNIAMHVSKNFNLDLAKKLGLSGKQRITVIFKINAKGNIIDVKSRAPLPELEVEAKRVINLLPQFTPGKQDGKAVTVPYSLPILFQIAPDKKEDKKN